MILKKIYPKDFILKKLYNSGSMNRTEFINSLLCYKISPSLADDILEQLVKQNLVNVSGIDITSSIYEVSVDGKEYLQNKHDRALYFWFPYIITTIIAILSLVVSFIR